MININKRPICECGEELKLHKTYTEHNYYNITLDGTRKSKKIHPNLPEYTNAKKGLVCLSCGNEYHVKRNKKCIYEKETPLNMFEKAYKIIDNMSKEDWLKLAKKYPQIFIPKETPLDSEVEEAFTQIGKYYCICSNPYTKTYAKTDPNFDKIHQAFTNMEEEIEQYERFEHLVKYSDDLILKERNNLKAKLDKVREVVNEMETPPPNTFIPKHIYVKKLKQILGDEKK